MSKKLAAWTLIAIGMFMLFLLIFTFATFGHGATTSGARSKELGTTSYTDNPFTYKVGKVYAVGYVDDSITLRVQPLATYGLFSEDVLICDWNNAARLFQDKHNPLILTYKTRATRSVQGIGCHNLVRVDEMKDTLPLGD